jgi:periplasmic copper chaperone A
MSLSIIRAAVAATHPRAEEKLGALLLAIAVLSVFADRASAHDFKVGAIEIEHPWSRATPPGAKVAAGYVEISNEGSAADRLVAASADIAGKTTIHEMANANGVMTMRLLSDGIAVPAKGEVALKPGSYHLMFEGLKQPLKQGEQFAGTLTFEKAGTVDVKFAVQGIGATSADHAMGQ